MKQSSLQKFPSKQIPCWQSWQSMRLMIWRLWVQSPIFFILFFSVNAGRMLPRFGRNYRNTRVRSLRLPMPQLGGRDSSKELLVGSIPRTDFFCVMVFPIRNSREKSTVSVHRTLPMLWRYWGGTLTGKGDVNILQAIPTWTVSQEQHSMFMQLTKKFSWRKIQRDHKYVDWPIRRMSEIW